VLARSGRRPEAAVIIAWIDRHDRRLDETPAGGVLALAEAFAGARRNAVPYAPTLDATVPLLDEILRYALAALGSAEV
jgi:hypothetical protein